jgi:hypothetical protein
MTEQRCTGRTSTGLKGIWAHGDYARRTPSGGFEILGRLDATLNVKGVRIGTAEVYRVVLQIARYPRCSRGGTAPRGRHSDGALCRHRGHPG